MWRWAPKRQPSKPNNVSTSLPFCFLLTQTEKENLNTALNTLETQPNLLSQFSPQHQDRLKRFLPFAVMNTTTRTQTFEKTANEMEWGPRTTHTYFSTIMSMTKILSGAPTPNDRAYLTTLEKAVRETPTWDYEDPGQMLNDLTISIIMANAASGDHTWVAAATALTTGQRLSDVCKLQRNNIVRINNLIAITFRHSKTERTKPPYTLHCKAESMIGQLVWKAAEAAEPYLFPTATTQSFHIRMTKAGIGKVDVRALRRTGLVRLAMHADLELLLEISQHASKQMLETYLNEGVFNFTKATKISLAISNAETTLMPSTRRPGEQHDSCI